MARYYQTGTAASGDALHQIMTYFAVNTLGWNLLQSNPWEKVSNSATDANRRRTSYFSIPGAYLFIANGYETYDNYLVGGVLEGWSETGLGSNPYAYDDQQGYQYSAYCDELYGPFTKYHLFGGTEGTGGRYLYAVVETTAGIFTHFGIGTLNRVGDLDVPFSVGLTWNMSTTYWRSLGDSHHQRMFDSSSAYQSAGRGHVSLHQKNPAGTAECYYFGNNDVTYNAVGGSVGGMNGEFISDSPNSMNSRAMLMPNHIRVRDAEDAWYRIVGIAPAFRTINIRNLQPEDIVDTDWMVFPVKAKNTTTGPNSGNYGWAYKFQGV